MIHCLREGCDRSWPRDPVLEVACPTCRAPAGRNCRRPSGHQAWGPHGRFCSPRDVAADLAGAYGPCPLGLCGMDGAINREKKAPPVNVDQPDFFRCMKIPSGDGSRCLCDGCTHPATLEAAIINRGPACERPALTETR
jgi:hypothetical protein